MLNLIHHPEQLDDEIYMGNVPSHDFNEIRHESSWKTNRYGVISYNSSKQPIKYMKPWFIKVGEVELAIEQVRLGNEFWSAERIKACQSMIDKRTIF